MSRNPFNPLLRFLLEMAALVILGRWGWGVGDGLGHFVLVWLAPTVAAAAWGTFRVPGDGGAPVVQVPGPVRLGLEAAFFGAAIWAASATGDGGWALPLGVTVVLHYALSWDRVAALATDRPLGGPAEGGA